MGGVGQGVGRLAERVRPLHLGVAQRPGQVVQDGDLLDDIRAAFAVGKLSFQLADRL